MDRQDIDALLIGALYGELTPADEARLAAHLDSHPTDRGALDDLKTARAAVRESRIFELQLDPPQAVSALLLQEAHRRAPKRAAVEAEAKESWFYRFTRVFLAHPAMAAAAMLVLVVGVAGTLYMKNGNMSAERKAEQADIQTNTPAIAATPPPQDPNASAQGSAATADNEGLAADKGEAHNAELAPAAEERQLQLEKLKAEKQQAERRRDLDAKKSAIMVDTPHPEPKELDETSRAKVPSKPTAPKASKKADSAGDRFESDDRFASPPTDNLGAATGSTTTTGLAGPGATGSIGGGGGASGRGTTATSPAGAPSRNAPAAQPAPPPPAAAPAPRTATVAKPSAAKEAEKPAEAKTEAAKDSSLIAWAKSEHKRAVSLVANGDCLTAAKIAVTVQNRAPEYFSQNMATDRALNRCQAYIAAERKADAEKSAKSRAKINAADEPAATH